MCPTGRILIEKENLLNKTTEFKKLFPDDITNIKLLTNALKKEFMENCSTRLHLLSFYTKDVLSDTLVLSEAQKSGIREAFLKIEDLLKIKPCQRAHECYLNKSTEETEGMKELRNKITKITLKEKLHKAISEIDTLILWINSFISEIRRMRQ
ncbi:interleukin-26 [Dendrobates tinctorius]|uniref:interleukin-26 n=1 Tax=Dendrobates tinctorius TaxID=92724 RepID=UPI003CCA3451